MWFYFFFQANKPPDPQSIIEMLIILRPTPALGNCLRFSAVNSSHVSGNTNKDLVYLRSWMLQQFLFAMQSGCHGWPHTTWCRMLFLPIWDFHHIPRTSHSDRASCRLDAETAVYLISLLSCSAAFSLIIHCTNVDWIEKPSWYELWISLLNFEFGSPAWNHSFLKEATFEKNKS